MSYRSKKYKIDGDKVILSAYFAATRSFGIRRAVFQERLGYTDREVEAAMSYLRRSGYMVYDTRVDTVYIGILTELGLETARRVKKYVY